MPAAAPVTLPLTVHVNNMNSSVVRDHKQNSAIMFPKSVSGFKAALAPVAADFRVLKAPPRCTVWVIQLGIFFLDESWDQRLYACPGLFEVIEEIFSYVDFTNAEDFPALSGFADFYKRLLAIKKVKDEEAAKEAAEAAALLVETPPAPKSKTPRGKRAVKSPKFVVSESDSDGEAPRVVGTKPYTSVTSRMEDLHINVFASKAPASTTPQSKRLKAVPALYEAGSAETDQLLTEVDALLKKAGPVPKHRLKEYIDALDRAAVRELFLLDLIRQLVDRLLARRQEFANLLVQEGAASDGVVLGVSSALPPVPEEDTVMSSKDA
ncbi:hypothetical protein H0H93_005217 [Arthromyces matolae]|nr:hypothetical protein H0H93_005217 [Arthromyces matolae]